MYLCSLLGWLFVWMTYAKKGVLESKEVKVREGRIAESLQTVAPLQYELRRNDAMLCSNPS